MIRNFTKFITDVRDNLLKQNNIDINDWINNNVTIELIKQVHINIKKIFYDLNL